MKQIELFLLFIISCFAASSQDVGDNEKWVRENYYKIEWMVPMRDSVKLFTAIYIPRDSSKKHPILFNRTPYSCSPYGSDRISPFLTKLYYFKYLKQGYIFAMQDVRGKYMSEGDYVDVRPFNANKKTNKDIDEASDTYDAIDWLVKNIPANNGNVGVMGISYPGFYSTMASLSNHPALKAVSPQAPVTDWFMGDDFHHNGAFFYMDGFAFYSGFGKPRPKPTTGNANGYEFTSQDNYDFYLHAGAIKNITELIGDSIAFWSELIRHPNYDAWWKARNPRNFVEIVKPATLVVGGLFDAEDCFGAWNLYKAIEQKAKNNNRLVEGPWYHGQWASNDGSFLGNIRFGSHTERYYQDSIEIPFFNYYLKGEGDVSKLSEATVFFSGENNWKHLDKWPPKNIVNTDLYLLANSKAIISSVVDKYDDTVKIKVIKNKSPLGTRNPSSDYTEYLSDPAKPVPYTQDVHLQRTREYMTDDQRFAARRPDVLVFETGELNNDITLAGPVIADFKVSISTTDADFVVKLIDVFPEAFNYDSTFGKGRGVAYAMGGYEMLVRGEIMRGRYRNSFEKPEAFIPSQVTTVKYTLPDVAHTFKKGHRIMIQVQSSWFPLADRNPQKFVDIYHADDSDFQKATIRIYHNDQYASKIILPVLKTSE